MLPVIFFIITLYCIERQIKHLSVPVPLLPFPPRYPREIGCCGVGERRLYGRAPVGHPFPPGGAGKPPPPCGTSALILGGDRSPCPGPLGSWAACSGLSPAGSRRASCWMCVWCRGRRLPPPRPPQPPPPPPPPAAQRGPTRRGRLAPARPSVCAAAPLVWGRLGAGSRLPGAGGDDFPVGICQVRVCAARRAPRLAPRVIYYLSPRRQRCGSGAAASNPRRRGDRRGVPEQQRAGRERSSARPARCQRSFSRRLSPLRRSRVWGLREHLLLGEGRGSRKKAFLRARRRLVVKKHSGAELEEKESNVFLIVI